MLDIHVGNDRWVEEGGIIGPGVTSLDLTAVVVFVDG